MKSLSSIINKLSHDEVETFRVFLACSCKSGQNKRLQLFNQIVSGESQSHPGVTASRQSFYQLKKRLQEELYSFLLTRDQTKDGNDHLFLEMDCHKKLYCFKILFDKGIRDHAHQILNEVLTVAAKHSLHSLYLESVNLKSKYFPQAQHKAEQKVPVNREIGKLKKCLSRNLYINQYLSHSKTSLFDDDRSFRKAFLQELGDFDLAGNEFVIDQLIEVNHLCFNGDFETAHDFLFELSQLDLNVSDEENITGLVYIELVKVCICLQDIDKAQAWMERFKSIMSKSEDFAHLFLDLQFIIAVRCDDTDRLLQLVMEANKLREIVSEPVLQSKWIYYALFVSFQQGDFKKVIKLANGSSILSIKSKSWLLHVKMLELFSIHQLEDVDWLYYKIENLRKMLTGSEVKHQRIVHLLSLLKMDCIGKQSSDADKEERIQRIENGFPWHPLGNELVNYCHYLGNKMKLSFTSALAGAERANY